MESMTTKLQASVTNAPIGALVGASMGYIVAKALGYDKTISVISFAMVGLILGAAVGAKMKR